MLGSSTRTSGQAHRICAGATVEGTIRFSGRLEVEGVVIGAVIADPAQASELIIGARGRVQGQIDASTIAISGQVEGAIRAGLRLDILAGARVDGDISYRDLQIQHGAVVEGALKPIEGEQVALKLVANSRT